MRVLNVTIGSDPELFIVNTKSGDVVSSIGLIPGEKGKEYHGEDMPKGFGLSTDNITAEFNIPPVTNEATFVNNIEYMKDYIKNYVAEKNPDLGIQCIASRDVNPDQLKSKQAKLFGCDPDYNAWTGRVNAKPQGDKTNLRSCGFHIHIGYANYNIDTSLDLVKYLDTYLGVPSVIIDKDEKRRNLYGKAGCFRITEYGVEYRVLSSTMMKDKDTLKLVWRGIQNAIKAYNTGGTCLSQETVEDIINNNNIDKAKYYIKKYNLCAEYSE